MYQPIVARSFAADAQGGRLDLAGDLEVFTRVAETGSFSAAARALLLAPSTVARIVDRIEARIGVRLLLRTTRALMLTPEGEAYLASARRILADLRETERAITHGRSPSGRLRVSTSVLFGRMFLVPLLRTFEDRYPAVRLDIEFTDCTVDVAGGQADIGIRLGPLASGSLHARKLAETRKVIVAAPDYLTRRRVPALPEDLKDHICIGLNCGRVSQAWPFRRDGRDLVVPIELGLATNSGDLERQLVLEGLGVARVCREAVEEDIKSGTLVPLLEDFNPGHREPVHAVFTGGSYMPARIRCFVAHVHEGLQPLREAKHPWVG